MINRLVTTIISNHMFGRAIWDKLPECIFEEFQKSKGCFILNRVNIMK